MTKSEHRVRVDNGKYTFVVPADDYRVSILRYGEPWHGPQGEASNALHAIMYALDAARVVVQAVRDARARLGEPRVPMIPPSIVNALALHDRLTSDREPPSAWCGGGATDADRIPPSARVPEPGPCTPFAHHWVSGSAVCQCGEATREGDCTGWKTASRLTGAQIYEAVTGHGKPDPEPEEQQWRETWEVSKP